MKKKILIALLAIFIIIQFIRPARNVSAEVPATHIANLYAVPENVQQVLKVSCYDCHSNNTVYPWYTNIQPVGWWLQSHVNEGKEHLDFSAFGSYPPKRQHHKLEEVLEQVQDNHMPLNSYLWMHNDAKLTPGQKTAVMNWAKNLMDQIAKTHNITGK
jgi:peptidoglycan hydrolase CwlO-like protein